MKDLKRSKNKGRKKRSKTKKSRTQQNKQIETVQETKSQEPKPINDESITPTAEQQTAFLNNTINPENVPKNGENNISRNIENTSDKPTIGKTISFNVKSTYVMILIDFVLLFIAHRRKCHFANGKRITLCIISKIKMQLFKIYFWN